MPLPPSPGHTFSRLCFPDTFPNNVNNAAVPLNLIQWRNVFSRYHACSVERPLREGSCEMSFTRSCWQSALISLRDSYLRQESVLDFRRKFSSSRSSSSKIVKLICKGSFPSLYICSFDNSITSNVNISHWTSLVFVFYEQQLTFRESICNDDLPLHLLCAQPLHSLGSADWRKQVNLDMASFLFHLHWLHH